jgi:hypothetical protein
VTEPAILMQICMELVASCADLASDEPHSYNNVPHSASVTEITVCMHYLWATTQLPANFM